MQVRELGDATYVVLDRTLAPSIRDHLDRFIITEDVTVEDMTDAFVQFGVYGPDSERVTSQISQLVVASWPGEDAGLTGRDVVVPAARAADAERGLTEGGGVPIDAATLDVARIEAGIPKFLVDMDTTTIPLEAGIEERAISMTKGCYVGQEVIVRVLHRGGGRVAKKLVQLRAESPLSRGDRLSSGDREIGRVTSAAVSPRLGPIALGYVQRDFAEPGAALVVKTNGTEVTATVVTANS